MLDKILKHLDMEIKIMIFKINLLIFLLPILIEFNKEFNPYLEENETMFFYFHYFSLTNYYYINSYI
jgi:hypothetical protein